MTRKIHFLVSVLMLAVLLVACAAPAAPTAAPTQPTAPKVEATAPAKAPAAPAPKVKRGGLLRGALQNDWVQFDPHLHTDIPTPHFQIFDPLVDWEVDDKGVWGPTPALAESWEMKGNEATFKLRKGVKFHDGSDFNADIAKWNLDRMMNHPKSSAKEAVACIDPKKGVEVVDPYTIRLNLKAPCGSLLATLAPGSSSSRANMISKAAIDKMGEEKFAQNPVGSGPFQFSEAKTADYVVLKRFEGYWQKGADGQPLPYLDGVRIRLIIDDSVRLLEVKSGNVDITDMIQGKDVPGVKSNPELVFVEAPWTGNSYRISFNSRPGSTDFANNLKLRQAALYAIDREAIAKTLGQGVGDPSKYFLRPGTTGYDDSVPYYWYNLDKSKQLMKDAGFPNGLDIKFDVISRALDQQQAQILKQMFDTVGIRTTIEVAERAAWVRKVQEAGLFQVSTSRHPYRSDPDFEMTRYVASYGGNNYPGRKNSDLDKCLEDGRSTYDTKQRHDIYKKCQSLIYDDAYYQYLWFQPWNYVMSKKVKGWKPSWAEMWRLKEVWIE